MGRPRPAATADRIGGGEFGGGEFGGGQIGTGQIGADRIGTAGQPRKPSSRTRIDTVLSRSVGGVSLVFAFQSLPIMLGQLDTLKEGWALAMASALAAAIVLVVLSTLLKVGVRVAAGSVSAIYLVALVAWPFLMREPGAVLEGKPWLWYLCTVATSCAAIAFPVFWAAIYTVVAPVGYGILRMLPAGGGADLLLASLDVVYAILLGQVVLIIIVLLRQATVAVDVAQSNALHKYAIAVRQHATEVERIEVDSIVHDSVLATLLSAAGVHSPKEAGLAATMARNAIARLNEAGVVPDSDETVIPFARLSERIRQAAAAIASPFAIIERNMEGLTVPVHASEALYSASVQAMVNSLLHAGLAGDALTRTLTMSRNPQGGCTIEIADSGVGFDPDAVPSERLGLRISIQERVTSAGGLVCVRTSIGHGTTITIQWPRPDGEPNSLVSQFSTEEIPVLALDDGPGGDGGPSA